MAAPRTRDVVVVLACLAVLAVAMWERASRSSEPAPGPRPPASPPIAMPSSPRPPIAAPDQAPRRPAPPPPALEVATLDLAWLVDSDERAAVAAVAAAIDRGGPFAYRRDGVVFENRERRLPLHPRGYWHEYTVATPGEDDRGARRLVAGERRELYYSRDHYRSFRAVRAAAP